MTTRLTTFLDGTANEEAWAFAYTAAGQPDSYTHPNGMVTDYVYDGNGILTDILHKDGSTVKQGFSYDEYDDVYNIKKVTHEDGSYWTYGYDDRYRLTSAVRHNANDTIQANYGYTYDAGDNMDSKTEPWVDDFSDGAIDTADWTKAGTWNVTGTGKAARNDTSVFGAAIYKTVNDDDIELRFAYTIDSGSSPYMHANFRYKTSSPGERLSVRFYPGQADLMYYNGSAWTTHTNSGATTTLGTKYNVRVEVDGANVKVWRSTGGGPETLLFNRTDAPTYDGDRVALQAGPNTVVSIDDVMILASGLERETVFAYRDNNEIESATDYNGAASYTFDAWGRTNTEAKNGVTRTYSWTSANLLAGINSSDTNETDVGYVYTGDLKRVWRSENGSLSNVYQWDAGFNVISEATVGNPLKTFVPGLAEVIGNDLSTSADYRYLTTDHLGSTRGMFDASKAALGAWEFTPYGAPFHFAGPADVTQLYTGHDLDEATGQYYAPFRFLNTALGRWLSIEPMGMMFGPNMYIYVGGHPTVIIDPSGLGWIGTRPLGGYGGLYNPPGTWPPLRHDQVFYGEPGGYRGRNRGFFNDGIHRDDPSLLDLYEPARTGMNDAVLAEAIRRVERTTRPNGRPVYAPDGSNYSLSRHNCQDYARDVSDAYDDALQDLMDIIDGLGF